MRRDIDPIKIIQILPLSNRPEKAPGGPNPWSEMLKKTLRATREASARMLTAVRVSIARVRPVSRSLYETLVSRAGKTKELPGFETPCEPDAERPGLPSTRSVEGSSPFESVAPNAMTIWLVSIRDSVRAAWPARRAQLDEMKNALTTGAIQWGKWMRQALGTQERWRLKTDQVVRPLISVVRSLRRRHPRLLDQVNATHSIVRSQQQEITELAFQLASVRRESAAHKKTLDDLTKQLHLLQTKLAQSLPTTHGTTGQSDPSSHGSRGTAATKRSGPSEADAQSTAEH